MVYHAMHHHHSYRSVDCETKLNREVYADSTIAGVANRGALRQIWRIACLEVAHSRFKIFRAIWVSVLSSGRKICHSNNISKKKKKSPHLVGLTFGGIFKPKVMEKVQRNRG